MLPGLPGEIDLAISWDLGTLPTQQTRARTLTLTQS